MTILEFQKSANRTCPDLGSELLNSLHMTVGMVTELKEVVACLKLNKIIDKINLSEELADIMWYYVNYAIIHNIDLETAKFKQAFHFMEEYETYPNLRPFDLMLIHAGDLLDYDKKALAYKKFKDPLKVSKSFNDLFYAISDMFFTYGLDPSNAMQNVIDKLKVRYPDKFTLDNAINRDLEQERKELEK